MKKLLRRISHWESWPFGLLYAPLVPFWIWYMLKSRSVWFFTPSNPKITFGGLEGEPKKEMYDLLPDHLYPKTLYVQPSDSFDLVLERLQASGIVYPFIVKPEVGWQGMLLRKIDDENALQHYHRNMPAQYIVQELVTYPMEVSVFYVRHPKETHGRVTGFLHKVPMYVSGNGRDSLEQLALSHPKASKRIEELKRQHLENWNDILPAGEKYPLSYAANHNRGAQFFDLRDHIDDSLAAVFDRLSLAIDDFFYGRYDIMCSSVEELKQGRGFTILEYNGCGAEPNHFYDTGYSLMQAYREILKHWKFLYEISAHNSRRGIKPWPLLKGASFLYKTRKETSMMRDLDARL
jgi:hypothetical protein